MRKEDNQFLAKKQEICLSLSLPLTLPHSVSVSVSLSLHLQIEMARKSLAGSSRKVIAKC